MDTSGPSMSQSSGKGKGNQNIQVYLRVRPLSAREIAARSVEVVEVPSNRDVQVRQSLDARITKKFTFDRVFGVRSMQTEVYGHVVAPFIGEVLAGYNCTVFAYGQTGTGKTFTMVGEESPVLGSSWEDNNPLGIIPRAVVHLFDELRMMNVEYSMRISYLELYNEELCDLLSTDDNIKIRIYEDSAKKGSVIVQGLEEIPVHTKDDVYKLLAKGQERRKTASTLMNAQSSRSHTVFSILVHIKENGIDGEEMLKTGKLNLVDLAGSENITKAGNEKGIRTREAVNINQSLLTLGRVITSLVERQPHVPYRESKLTRLLQESLGGRTKTSIIATISPGHKDLEETLNTLDYAFRAKNIQNRPEVNQRTTKKAVLKEYTEEIDRLKRDLIAAREKNGIYLPAESYSNMTYQIDCQTKELNEKVLMIRALKDEMDKKEAVFDEMQKRLEQKTQEFKITSDALVRTNRVLRDTKDSLNVAEQRCQESSCLIQAYQTTEKTLTEQATSLVQVADTASSDTHGLHEALKRRKIVDQKINTTVEKFTAGAFANLDTLSGNVSSFQENLLTKSHQICEEMDERCKDQSSMANDVKNTLNMMKTSSQISSNESTQLFSQFRQMLPDSLGEHHDKLLSILKKIEVSHENYRKDMDNQVNKMETLEAKQLENLSNVFGIVESCEKNIRNDVEKFTNENKRYLNNVKYQIHVIAVERNEEIRKMVMENKEISMKAVEDAKKAMAQLVAQIEASNQESNENYETILSLTHSNEQDKINLDDEIRGNNIHILDYRENFVNNMTRMNTDLADAKTSCVENSVDIKQVIGEVREKNHSHVDNTVQNIAEAVENVKLQHDHVKAKVDEMHEKIQKKSEEASQELIEQINTICKIATKEEESVLQSRDAVKNIVAESKAEVVTFHESVQEDLQKIHSDISNLKTTELKTYTSTGDTPGRKDFKYPRELAATSPHERILNRFRAKLPRPSPLDDSSEMPTFDHGPPAVSSTPFRQDPSLKELNAELHVREQQKRDSKNPSNTIEISSDEENTDMMI